MGRGAGAENGGPLGDTSHKSTTVGRSNPRLNVKKKIAKPGD